MKRLYRIATSLLVAGVTLFGCSSMPFGSSSEGWITLFDGYNLNKWTAIGNANWRLADGNIQAELGSGYLVSKDSFKDFQIKAEFWVDDEANTGIFLRCADPKKLGADNCYEVNIFDKRPDPDYGTGAIVNVAKVSPMPKAGGKWNTYDITAKGPQLTVVFNGVKTVDVQDSKLASGVIGLQYFAGVVKFRKVQIRPL